MFNVALVESRRSAGRVLGGHNNCRLRNFRAWGWRAYPACSHLRCWRRAVRPNLGFRPASHPSVSVGEPLKSEGGKRFHRPPTKIGSAASASPGRKRLPTPARIPPTIFADEGMLLRPRSALPRPAPTPGSYNCRLIKLGKATAKAHRAREIQAVLLLRRGRGRPVDHRQADRQPASGRPAVGGR